MYKTTSSSRQNEVDSLWHSVDSRTITQSQETSDVTDRLNLSEAVMSSNSQPQDIKYVINIKIIIFVHL